MPRGVYPRNQETRERIAEGVRRAWARLSPDARKKPLKIRERIASGVRRSWASRKSKLG